MITNDYHDRPKFSKIKETFINVDKGERHWIIRVDDDVTVVRHSLSSVSEDKLSEEEVLIGKLCAVLL
jgi:hypothetical protein